MMEDDLSKDKFNNINNFRGFPLVPFDDLESKAVPNPGSDDALDEGCTCAVMDNHHGRGFMYKGERQFWVTSSCPLHGKDSGYHK